MPAATWSADALLERAVELTARDLARVSARHQGAGTGGGSTSSGLIRAPSLLLVRWSERWDGLLRQHFRKGNDLSWWSSADLEAVALANNNRPRKILGRRTPAEVFEQQLRSLQQPGVATTG